MVKFELDVNKLNVVLAALGNMPYAQVFEAVEIIQRQAREQMNNSTSTIQ